MSTTHFSELPAQAYESQTVHGAIQILQYQEAYALQQYHPYVLPQHGHRMLPLRGTSGDILLIHQKRHMVLVEDWNEIVPEKYQPQQNSITRYLVEYSRDDWQECVGYTFRTDNTAQSANSLRHTLNPEEVNQLSLELRFAVPIDLATLTAQGYRLEPKGNRAADFIRKIVHGNSHFEAR